MPVREGLFASTGAEPRLLGGRCRSCRRHHFPRTTTCPYCSSVDVEPIELSTRGALWSWTAVTAPPPGYHGTVPFGFGIVELPDGLRVVTRLTYPVDGYELGMPMRLAIVPLHTTDDGETVVTYEFTPDPDGAR